MSLILSGTDGLSDVDGSASTPAIRGTDANTGIFFPAADTIAFAEGGTEVMRIDSTGAVGIGVTNPNSFAKLAVNGNFGITAGQFAYLYNSANSNYSAIACVDTSGMAFYTAATERMRINSSGRLLINSPSFTEGMVSIKCATSTSGMAVGVLNNGDNAVNWYNASNTYLSSIVVNSGTVAYNTSSDYRLKENVAPMTSALATVAQLNPVTWNWKIDGKSGQGFIAHELQTVVPDAVTGEKDAVDAEGNPKYQGVDTSFLVATLTAAIQELKAIVDAQAVEIAELKAK